MLLLLLLRQPCPRLNTRDCFYVKITTTRPILRRRTVLVHYIGLGRVRSWSIIVSSARTKRVRFSPRAVRLVFPRTCFTRDSLLSLIWLLFSSTCVSAYELSTAVSCLSCFNLVNPLTHIKTADQRTVTQQYGDWYTGRWWMDCYIWYNKEGPRWAAAPPNPLLAVSNVTANRSTLSAPTSYL